MTEPVISKSIYKILTYLTGEVRFEVALYLATKELVLLKIKDVEEQIKQFEQHYQMDFNLFNKAWNEGKIANKHSYEVEHDYWEWETAITNRTRLEDIFDWMLH